MHLAYPYAKRILQLPAGAPATNSGRLPDVLVRVEVLYWRHLFYSHGRRSRQLFAHTHFVCWFLYSALLETWCVVKPLVNAPWHPGQQAGGPSFLACVLRNFIAIADLSWGLRSWPRLLGLSPQFQRLGDLAARTMVVRSERVRRKISYQKMKSL